MTKLQSKFALCADENISLQHFQHAVARFRLNVGLYFTMSQLIRVSLETNGGIGRSGFTSVSNTSAIAPSRTTTAANSVMRCEGTASACRLDIDDDDNESPRRPVRARRHFLQMRECGRVTSVHLLGAVNSGRPENIACAMCSATTRGAPGRLQTWPMRSTTSRGPVAEILRRFFD